MFTPFNTKLAGVTFDDCQNNINKWGHQDIGYFSLVIWVVIWGHLT